MNKTKSNLIAFLALVILPIIGLIIYVKVEDSKTNVDVIKVYNIEYIFYEEGNVSSGIKTVNEGYIDLPTSIQKKDINLLDGQ